MRWWKRVAALALVVSLWWWRPQPVDPGASGLDVSQLPPVLELASQVRVDTLEDETGELRAADVRTPTVARRFRPNRDREIAFGFTSSAVWLRFEVHNPSAQPVRWLLQVGEPTLDHLDLHVLHADGRSEVARTGFALPFAEREVAHVSFVFARTIPAHGHATYLLRAQSSGPVRLPLRAWQSAAWLARPPLEEFGHWLLYGALGVLMLSSFGVFVVTRDREHLWSSLVSACLLTMQSGMAGHLSQFVFPGSPGLPSRIGPLAISGALLAIALFARAAFGRVPTDPRVPKILDGLVVGGLLLMFLGAVLPVSVALRFLCFLLLPLCAAGTMLIRQIDVRLFPEAQLYRVCWMALICTVPITVLRYANVLPPIPIFDWALRIGILVHAFIMSLAVASWVNAIRHKMVVMNEALSLNVSDLQLALERAEQAGQEAQRATQAKDDFMATMSHELRTPLNAIINIPQGILQDFETVRSARCRVCDATFLLDEGDLAGPTSVCEECQGQGTLVEGTKVLFHGDQERCLRLLQKIERSGQHLLQMVNGVLDYNKLEAGRFELSLAEGDLEAVAREVVDQMSDLAQSKKIQLDVVVAAPEPITLMFDSLRIKQVLINLTANALKFCEPGATVTIRLSSTRDAAIIEVHDTGIGIAKENHERIFVGFEQVHKGDTRKYGGTGLGLSISRSLVRMHGGELSVRSELGKGSTFIVRLPLPPVTGIARAV